MIKKIFYLLIISLLSCLACNAQTNIVDPINRKIAELKNDGVDTVVCYYKYCIGNSLHFVNPNDTTCFSESTKFLLWFKGKQSYIQKFDQCRQYPVMSASDKFMLLMSSNYKRIKQEQIKPPTFDTIIKGKKQTINSMSVHSCYSKFEFHSGSTSFDKTIDDYALETKYIEGKYLNKSYQYNHSTVLYKLKTLIEAELKNLKL